jgi:pyruvate dehydrogenase phosphatase
VDGKNIGYYNAVFDGHGGWQLAEYSSTHLHTYIEEKLKEVMKKRELSDEDYKGAIEYAFDKIENEFLDFSREGFKKGFPRVAYVGACALVTVVANNKAYIASAGDCKAAIVRTRGDNYEAIKASKRFSANKKSEQQRLAKEFPADKDIVVCVIYIYNK